MQCTHVQSRLVERLYGELSQADSAAMDEHLASCGVCRQQAAALQETAGALDRHTVDLPELNVLTVLDEWSRRERQRRLVRTGGVCLALAASLLLMTRLLFDVEVDRHHLSLRWGHPQQPSPAQVDAAPYQLAADSSWELRQRVLRGGFEALDGLAAPSPQPSTSDTLRARSFYHHHEEP